MKLPLPSAIVITSLAVGAVLYNGTSILAMAGHAMPHPAAKVKTTASCHNNCVAAAATAVAKGNGAKAVAENHITNVVKVNKPVQVIKKTVVVPTHTVTRTVVVKQTRTVVVPVHVTRTVVVQQTRKVVVPVQTTRTVVVPAQTQIVTVAAQATTMQTPSQAVQATTTTAPATLPATGPVAAVNSAFGLAGMLWAGWFYLWQRRHKLSALKAYK